MKTKGLLLILLLGEVYGVCAQNPDAIQDLLRTEGLREAAIGISVKSVAADKNRIDYRSEMALTPASVMKLLPTWLALEEKGEEYRFQTTVYYSGKVKDSVLTGNVIVVSGRDPALDSRYFPGHSFLKTVVNAIESCGIRRIRGRIIIEGAEKGVRIPGSWPWEDVSNYYAALYLPFNYRDNTFILQFQSGKPGQAAKLISVNPFLPGIHIRNEVKASGNSRDDAWIFGGPYSPVLCVRGSIPPDRSAFQVKGAMHDPATVFAEELTRELSKRNIPVEQEPAEEENRQELLTFYSPALGEIVFHTNKSSVNLFAEALGYLTGTENWPEKIRMALKRIEVDVAGITVKDACGLSPLNALPARVFTDLLVYAGQQEQNGLIASLPVAGVDRGLAGYCRTFPELKNRLKAKTGSMSGVRCLAGYITRKNGEQLAFTILINHYTCETVQLQNAVGKFLNSLL